MKLLGLLAVLFLGGCASATYHVIDITENQWIEDAEGNRCIQGDFVINPETITYYYENCPIRRVVKPKIRPTPKPKQCEKPGSCLP